MTYLAVHHSSLAVRSGGHPSDALLDLLVGIDACPDEEVSVYGPFLSMRVS